MMNRASPGEPVVEFAGASSDYDRVARAIEYLESHFLEQPDLKTVAKAVHLSEYHFQRLFTRWAGISPKRFLQCLTAEHAKVRLAESKAVLETALESGLSGPGRLHDLFVSVEGVTPGEYKTRGAGIQVAYGFHATRFGTCLLGVTRRGICWLSFIDGGGRSQALRELQSQWSGAELAERPERTNPIAKQIFPELATERNSSLSLLLMGTNFQINVWRALLTIPAGAVLSYEALGGMIGASKAARAVGSAVGRNSVAYLIPCHRVIRKTGLLGGYRWGETRKKALLAWESTRALPATSKTRNLRSEGTPKPQR